MCILISPHYIKWLRLFNQYYFCQDTEFRFTMGTLSVNNELLLWLRWNRFLCTQCLKIMVFLKDGADLRMESFSCKQSLHTLSPGANGFTFLTTSHLI